MKKTLKIGIAPREVVACYTRDVIGGRRRRRTDDPDIWLTSVESLAKVLSERNRALLALIAEHQPDSLDALAEVSGRAKSDLSRTLHTMAHYGLVHLEKGEGRKFKPIVTFERVEVRLALTV